MVAWAKRDRDAPEDAPELSLLAHGADVAAMTEALLLVPTIRRRLDRLAGRPIDDGGVARLACLAFWHDIGKANVGFWSRRFDDRAGAVLRRRAGLEPTDTGHTAIVATLFCGRRTKPRFERAFRLPDVLGWGCPGVEALFWAAISHHGTPLYCSASGTERIGFDFRYKELDGAWAPIDGYDPMAEVAALAEAARRWMPDAFVADAPGLPDLPAFVHAFAGIVSLADWIASNPAPGFFPYEEGGDDRMAFARRRAREVLRRMRIDVEATRGRLRGALPDFVSVFGFEPSEAQAAMACSDLGPVVVLESETGSGKTEAALWRFAHLFAAGEVDSLAFLLPTRVAATALKGRIERFLTDLFGAEPPPLNCVLGVPGYAYADGQEAERLAGFETLWPDSRDEDAAHRRWASEHPKRSLAAAVMIGTVDQALLGALRVRHAHLRGAALLRSLVVVDEVHASDAYMAGLLREVLDRQVRAGGHALLLSATLGGAVRRDLLAAGRRSVRLRPGQVAAPEPDHTLAPYPAISDGAGVRVAPAQGATRHVKIEVRREIDDPAAIGAWATEAARAGARVLVVRNTVDTAVAVQSAVEAGLADDASLLFSAAGVPAPHHGRYAAADRRVLDAAVEAAFGKHAPRPHGVMLVGTQTLEQSLDIDADLLITDLAPADVLLQRFGRLHRHRRERPAGFEVATAIVLAPADGLDAFLKTRSGRPSHGFGTVYANLPSLRATLMEIDRRPSIAIPDDCRALVEAAVDAERLRALCEGWGGGWSEAWQAARGSEMSMESEAGYARLDWGMPWSDPNLAFPRRGEERLRTRLGGDDRLVALPEPWTSPFGQALSVMKIPDWMLRGMDDEDLLSDAQADVLESEEAFILLRWRRLMFRYDRLGLRRIDSAQ